MNISEDDLESFGFTKYVEDKIIYVKTRMEKGKEIRMVCEYSVNSISHKVNGKEVARWEFFEEAIK